MDSRGPMYRLALDERPLWVNLLGKRWTDQNKVDAATRIPFFRTLLKDFSIRSILEVGCNRGYNLDALSEVGEFDLVGMDICRYPLDSARLHKVVQADILYLPFQSRSFDLVFTVGVLLYFTPEQLYQIVQEFTRVTKRYVLAIEYGVEDKGEELEVLVRYKPNVARFWEGITVWWGRNYSSIFPGLLTSGYLGKKKGFNDCSWWLFEKPQLER